MSLTPEEMAKELAKMRARFRDRLELRLDEVRVSLEAAREQEDAASLSDLRHVVHKLHGTAGSYGLNEVAEALREMERLVDTMAAGDKPDGAWDALATHLGRAGAAAEE